MSEDDKDIVRQRQQKAFAEYTGIGSTERAVLAWEKALEEFTQIKELGATSAEYDLLSMEVAKLSLEHPVSDFSRIADMASNVRETLKANGQTVTHYDELKIYKDLLTEQKEQNNAS
jgi:hypothetical protein